MSTKERPTSVAAIGWLLVVLPPVAVLSMLRFALPSDPQVLLHRIGGAVLCIVIGIGILMGLNWARMTYVLVWPISMAYNCIVYGFSPIGHVPAIIIYIVILVILTRPGASAFFRQERLRLFQFFVGYRYLRSKWTSFFSISGIALGVMVLVVVLSVMGGFIREMRGRIKGILSDIIVERGDIFGFSNYEEVMRRISAIPHVKVCSPHLEGLALIRLRNYRKWAYFKGVDPELEIKAGSLGKYLVGGRPPDFKMGHDIKKPWPIVIGRELVEVGRDERGGGSEYMGVGEDVVLVTLRGADQPQSKTFAIAGLFKSGMFEFDSTIVYIPLDLAQRWRGATNPATITSLSVALDDYRYAPFVKEEIYKALGNSYIVKTWEEERAGFLRAIALERSVMGVILFFIIIVAGFMILALLTTVVVEKTKDIGILKAIGGTTGGILHIFLLNGLLMGIIGAAIGAALGLAISFTLNWIADRIYDATGFSVFPKDIYYLDKIPREINLGTIVTICYFAILVSFLASFYPAWRAARMDPVEALRYE